MTLHGYAWCTWNSYWRAFKCFSRSNILRRLFVPKIDKIPFTHQGRPCDTRSHPNLVSLLQQMVHPAWQQAVAFGAYRYELQGASHLFKRPAQVISRRAGWAPAPGKNTYNVPGTASRGATQNCQTNVLKPTSLINSALVNGTTLMVLPHQGLIRSRSISLATSAKAIRGNKRWVGIKNKAGL